MYFTSNYYFQSAYVYSRASFFSNLILFVCLFVCLFLRFGHFKVAKLLLSEKGNVKCVHTKDKRNRDTSILIASQFGHLDIINLLLSKGASIEDKSRFGETAIYYASQNGHADIVELLISKGANMEEKDAKMSLLSSEYTSSTAKFTLLAALLLKNIFIKYKV